MLPQYVKNKLVEIGRQVKELLPGVNANVQINVGAKQPLAIVNVSLTDVTEVKK